MNILFRFTGKRHLAEIASIDRMIVAQQKALEALRGENRELYLAAIKPDDALVNFKALGPTRTPPIPEYLQVRRNMLWKKFIYVPERLSDISMYPIQI